MKRDSLYGETVLWSGRPKDISTPLMYRVASAVSGVTSAISTAAAVVLATALDARPGGLLGFAAWMATLAVAFYFGPRWWRSELLFTLTDQHIVMRRGRKVADKPIAQSSPEEVTGLITGAIEQV